MRFRDKLSRVAAGTLLLLACADVLLAASDPEVPSSRVIHTFDARPLYALDLRERGHAEQVWDTLHTLAALQGLANRDEPSLYLLYCRDFGVQTDVFWLDWLQAEDPWLRGAAFKTLPDLETVVRTFWGCFKGLVVYDGRVPSTSNLASTAAGCEQLLPVRFDPSPDSVYTLLATKLSIPVKLWLVQQDGTSLFTGDGRIPDSEVPSTGSAKADAYVWSMARYLQTGKCAPRLGAYYIDAFWTKMATRADASMHTLPNHDYFVSKKAFFFDLSPWGDETPNDDPEQPAGLDKRMFLQVMRGLYDRSSGGIIKIGGFPPWPFKYTSHADSRSRHEGVPTEWEFGRLISQFNAYKEADAAGLGAIANASFFQHYPLRPQYKQKAPRPKRTEWLRAGHLLPDGKVAPRLFVGHYVGDYDSPSWLYKAVPAFFRDPARGKVPLAWAFNPNLADRAPQALVYAWGHATSNDFFVAGDSGAGYLNARALTIRPDSGLPPGLAKWAAYCTERYERWDLSITGFILDGAGGASTAEEFGVYRTFSPNGAGTHFEKQPAVIAGLSTCPEIDLPDDPAAAARVLLERAGSKRKDHPGFFWARSILKSPTWYVQVSEHIEQDPRGSHIRVVDPYTFFGLIEVQFGK